MTDDAEQILSVARALWQAAALAVPIRLLGVSVSSLEASAGQASEQLGLFDPRAARTGASPSAAARRLGPTLDAITERFGAGAIGRAVEGVGKITQGRGIKRGD